MLAPDFRPEKVPRLPYIPPRSPLRRGEKEGMSATPGVPFIRSLKAPANIVPSSKIVNGCSSLAIRLLQINPGIFFKYSTRNTHFRSKNGCFSLTLTTDCTDYHRFRLVCRIQHVISTGAQRSGEIYHHGLFAANKSGSLHSHHELGK